VYDPPEIINGEVLPAGDVWSLGITLVQAVTQQLPQWNGTEQDAPVLPLTMPPQYIDLVRRCLRREPSHRGTIDEIAPRIKADFTVLPEPIPARQNVVVNWRYTVPVAAMVLAALVFAGRKLSSRHPEPEQISSTSPANPQLHSKPEQKAIAAKNENAPSVRGSKAQASNLAPPAVPLRSAPQPKTFAGSSIQGAVVEQVLPDVPRSASDTITGTVRVRVRVAVDPAGNVTNATLDSSGPSKYFANLALRAAGHWKFKPPQRDGKDVASEWLLNFGFRKTSSTVSPVEVAP
jgi:TonB family protein